MPQPKRVVLCGGSGLVGRALIPELLQREYHVSVLTRGSDRTGSPAYVHWDGRHVGPWAKVLENAAVINLVGRSVDCRWTRANREQIVASRVDSVRALQEAVETLSAPPLAVVQCSATGFFGDTTDMCTESSPAGNGFLAETCRAWEDAFSAGNFAGARKVLHRLGVVLSADGGALTRLAKLTRWFLGGRAGPGTQFVSWIHVKDLVGVFIEAIENDAMTGVYNAVSPNPVTNDQLMTSLRHVLHRPWSPPVPAPMLRLGAALMGTSAELALGGQRCIPQRLSEQGFAFAYPEIGPALRDLLAR